jgi:hypothetical protein
LDQSGWKKEILTSDSSAVRIKRQRVHAGEYYENYNSCGEGMEGRFWLVKKYSALLVNIDW